MATAAKAKKAGPGGGRIGAKEILDSLPQESRKTFRADIRRIRPDPKQPRTSLRPVDGQIDKETQEYIFELAGNIKDIGLQEPIKLREDPEYGAGYWMIVYGECRWRAHLYLSDQGDSEFDFIDAYEQRDTSDLKRRLIQVSENIQRRNLSDIETATAMKDMLIEFQELEQKDLADIWKKSRSYVTRILSLIDPQYADLVEGGFITHASVLEQYRSLSEKSQRMLIEQSQNSGKPINMTEVRIARDQERGKSSTSESRPPASPGGQTLRPPATPATPTPAYQELRLRQRQMEVLVGFLDDDADLSVTLQLSIETLRRTIRRMGGQPVKNDMQLVQQLIDLLEQKKGRKAK